MSGQLRQRLFAAAVLLACAVLFWAGAAAGRDYEQSLAERILEHLDHGQPVWLPIDNDDFLSLYTPVYGARPNRAVLLVHGMGGHPDWPEVIQPLRTRLPGRGWSTLSLQMPLLPAGTPVDDYGGTVPEAVRRITAGVEFLRGRDYRSVFVIGYGFGAASALSYQAEQSEADGVVVIGVLAREYLQPQVDLTALIGRINMPVLDVYGGRDFTEVIRKAQDRRQAARRAGNTDFMQAVVEGADHYFTGHEEMLIRIISDWLDRFPVGINAPAAPEAVDGNGVEP